MLVTCGLIGSDSFEHADQPLLSESKLLAKMDIVGSTELRGTSKGAAINSQLQNFPRRRSVRHIDGSGSTLPRSLPPEKKCSKCSLVKPSHEFGTDTAKGRFRLRSECYECARLRHWHRRMEKSGKTTSRPRSYQSRETARSYSALYRARYPARTLVGHARNRARQKNLPFNLCAEDILPALEAGRCQITGIPFVRDPPRNPRSALEAIICEWKGM